MEKVAQNPTAETQLFRDVFDASPIGIAVENLDGQPLFVDRAHGAILGFSAEELCSKHCVDSSPTEGAERDCSIDHYQMEKRYFLLDGSIGLGKRDYFFVKSKSFLSSASTCHF